jgi:hypothetical protein
LYRFYRLCNEIKRFLNENYASYSEVDIFLEWWLKVAFLLDIMGMLSNIQMDFQGENKMVTVIASIVLSLERKLKCM